MLSVIQLADIFPEVCTTDTNVTLNIHEVTQSQDYFLNLDRQFTGWREAEDLSFAQCCVQTLKDGNWEGGSFTGARLRLSDNITTFYYGNDTSLLNSGRFFKSWKIRMLIKLVIDNQTEPKLRRIRPELFWVQNIYIDFFWVTISLWSKRNTIIRNLSMDRRNGQSNGWILHSNQVGKGLLIDKWCKDV